MFPPTPVYPRGIDSDYTLYLVYNTTETRICQENEAWADEIEIVAVADDKTDIWADNGFGNISGELFYYDAVEKNSAGKVFKLKKCARNLGGSKTKYNPPQTWVRSYVIAEHHNQLIDAVFNIENFVGYNFDPREETLDWRIRNLQALPVIFDDFACPDVVFTWNVVETDAITGVLVEYLIEITSSGATGNFEFSLDFGDGETTTTSLSGTHRYPINVSIDPVLIISNDKCQTIIAPIETEIPEVIDDVFEIPIPGPISVPDFLPVPFEVPEPQINLPPFVFPCISFQGQIGPIPSVIEGPDISLPSYVLIEGLNYPISIPSYVLIEGGFSLPSIIFHDIPPTIVIDPPIPPTIVIVASSTIALSLDAVDVPKMEIEWGRPPDVEVALSFPKKMKSVPMNALALAEFGEEFADLFDADHHVMVESEEIGIPDEIRIIPPTMPKIEFDLRDFPKTIKVDTLDAKIPEHINIYGPETPIPDRIVVDGINIPESITLVDNVPNTIELVSKTNIPDIITVEVNGSIPDKIIIEAATPIPSRIMLEAVGIPNELKVVGIPDHIEVIGFPEFIPLKMPENPEIELVYKGAPIELKIDLQPITDVNEEGQAIYPCVQLVPCSR